MNWTYVDFDSPLQITTFVLLLGKTISDKLKYYVLTILHTGIFDGLGRARDKNS